MRGNTPQTLLDGTISEHNQLHLPAEIAAHVSIKNHNLAREYVKVYYHDSRDEIVLAGTAVESESLNHLDDKQISTPGNQSAEDAGGRITLPASQWQNQSLIPHGAGETNNVIIELIDCKIARVQSTEYYTRSSSPSI